MGYFCNLIVNDIIEIGIKMSYSKFSSEREWCAVIVVGRLNEFSQFQIFDFPVST